MYEPQTDHKKNRKIAAALAIMGALQPTPVPVAGIHKFYTGQYGWGLVYLLLGGTQVPRIASAAEGVWYLMEPHLQKLWGHLAAPVGATSGAAGSMVGETVDAVASSLREIEQLRQEGLLSEYEFEQKRRSLLEQIP
ncbi:hypothetical protein IQ260_20325 [Leptolyngbya cf. ectocarpi LEGE 11479]|uniref:SHOCT domain-containing protein n=1 Tax=Leptolyngbya cf. ectocarpi LEGE 11479 TaxID=1828722 RepID=A0A929FBH3_LEPEC|nr:hypothetical protein [Leptolyngbya ectocarpi]MBE9068994.1 hypothetical protein [Leptolyngbya cf. ectocarpi LEGE 11479]